MVNQKILELAVQNAWSSKTSNYPELWTPKNPSSGQSEVTVLVLDDFLKDYGITRVTYTTPQGDSGFHYFNTHKNNSTRVDLTIEQYPIGTQFGNDRTLYSESSDQRDFLLHSSDMAHLGVEERYQQLKRTVEKWLDFAAAARELK